MLMCAIEAVKDVISSRRYETITLHGALQGFRLMDCRWLDVGDNSKHAPPSEHAKRRELIEELLYWYISCFVIPLLRVSRPSICFIHRLILY